MQFEYNSKYLCSRIFLDKKTGRLQEMVKINKISYTLLDISVLTGMFFGFMFLPLKLDQSFWGPYSYFVCNARLSEIFRL